MKITKFTTELQQAAISVTDKCMQIKNEILTCIKLTITYYWEIAFAITTYGIENCDFKVANNCNCGFLSNISSQK